MITRLLQNDVQESLSHFPVVGLIGARQVGKTTLARMLANATSGRVLHLDLEKPSDLARLSEPELYLEQYSDSLVILDEIQRKPELFPILRSIVDSRKKNGRFLILGSASPALIRQSSESLAGRIIYHELSPFCLSEVGGGDDNVRTLWSRGGYPLSFLADSDKLSLQWRRSFIDTHLERDIPNLGVRVATSALRRFWQMLAHCHAQLLNANKIAAGLGISSPTVRHYLDILSDTFMIRQLQPFHANVKKRLVKSPKIYLRDSGILHALLRINDHDSLIGHPSCGPSWEGWVIEQLMAVIPRSWETYFYRTSAGAEIDLLVRRSATEPPIAIEIKYSLDPRPAKGFWSAIEDLAPVKGFVVYPGTDFYPLAENVQALPIAQLDRVFSNGTLKE